MQSAWLFFEGQTQLNCDVLKLNTLVEIQDPQDQPLATPIVQTQAIQRDPQQYRFKKPKKYQLVYNKRVLDPETYLTYPYGYVPPTDRLDAYDILWSEFL